VPRRRPVAGAVQEPQPDRGPAASGLSPERLEIEITESVLLSENEGSEIWQLMSAPVIKAVDAA